MSSTRVIDNLRRVEIFTRLSDAELLTLAVLQALLGFSSEARFIRYAHAHCERSLRFAIGDHANSRWVSGSSWPD